MYAWSKASAEDSGYSSVKATTPDALNFTIQSRTLAQEIIREDRLSGGKLLGTNRNSGKSGIHGGAEECQHGLFRQRCAPFSVHFDVEPDPNDIEQYQELADLYHGVNDNAGDVIEWSSTSSWGFEAQP